MKRNPDDIKTIKDFAKELTSDLNEQYGWLYSFSAKIDIDKEVHGDSSVEFEYVEITIVGKQEHDPKLDVVVKFRTIVDNPDIGDYKPILSTQEIEDTLTVREPFSWEWVEVGDLLGDFWFNAMNFVIDRN